MNSLNVATLGSARRTDPNDPLVAFTPPSASAENAEAFVRRAVWSLDRINRGLDPDKTVLPREEYNARYVQWGEDRIASGEDAEIVNASVEYFTSDVAYNRELGRTSASNYWKERDARESVGILEGQQARLSEIFKVDLKVTYDETGRGTIDAIDIYYANGEKMLSYGEDGSLTTYNADGTIRSNYAQEDVAWM